MGEKKKKRSPKKLTPSKARRPKKKKTKSELAAPKTVPLQVMTLRKQAGYDYVTDPDGRSVRWHYEREDREYSSSLKWSTFEKWSKVDGWVAKRREFWEQIEERTLQHLQDEILRVRLEELAEMSEKSRPYMMEYMQPLRDEEDNVLRHPMRLRSGEPHPHAGLPVFPLEMPSIDKFIRAFLQLDERIMLKRGEAVTRTESIGDGRSKTSVTALDPVGSLMNLSPEEARSMAKSLLKQRFDKQMSEADELDSEVVHIEAERKRGSDDEEDDDDEAL